MKMSEVQIVDIKSYINVTNNEDDPLIGAILIACKQYIQGYTGLSTATLDTKEDLTMALFVLASELYDNRAFNVESSNVNPFIESILHMHSINLL